VEDTNKVATHHSQLTINKANILLNHNTTKASITTLHSQITRNKANTPLNPTTPLLHLTANTSTRPNLNTGHHHQLTLRTHNINQASLPTLHNRNTVKIVMHMGHHSLTTHKAKPKALPVQGSKDPGKPARKAWAQH